MSLRHSYFVYPVQWNRLVLKRHFCAIMMCKLSKCNVSPMQTKAKRKDHGRAILWDRTGEAIFSSKTVWKGLRGGMPPWWPPQERTKMSNMDSYILWYLGIKHHISASYHIFSYSNSTSTFPARELPIPSRTCTSWPVEMHPFLPGSARWCIQSLACTGRQRSPWPR